MAPELHGICSTKQATDKYADYAFAADIWALGEITYHLLTRMPSFTNIALLYQYCQNALGFPLEVLNKRQASFMAQYFVLSLLNPSPLSRPVIRQVCLHPWILQHGRKQCEAVP
jgi:hypothetical protein